MELVDRDIGNTTVLFGDRGGKYPHGNSLLVRGRDATAIIDPSLGVLPRRDALPRIDLVLNSHCHEDHIAGNHLFPDVPWRLHEEDLPGILSLEGFLGIYGFPDEIETDWARAVVDQFHFTARPDAGSFEDEDVIELGGDVRIHVVHTPGHTRGHSALFVEPDGVLYLGDIDLSSFGPYYGDAWSDLEDFERSLRKVREFDAAHYATFHHIGVLDGREAFLDRLDRYAEVIVRRETRLLEFLAEPRSMDEVVAHRFVYRPGDAVSFADGVERRSMGLHVERLLRDGRVDEPEPARFRAVAG